MSAPQDYDEFFLKYRDYVVALVKKEGIDAKNAEDVAHDILIRFWRRGFLEKFDPELRFNYHGTEHKARFKSFLTKFVLTYLLGHRDKQRRHAQREVLIMDMPITTGGAVPAAGTDARSWGDSNGEPEPSAEDCMLSGDWALGSTVTYLRSYIANVPRRSKFDTCDLARLFDEVLRQIDDEGAWDVNELRQIFGVSSTAMHSWMWWLRENLAEALDTRLPRKRNHGSSK